MSKTFGCWETAQTAGPLLGRIDVVGVREFGGDLAGRSEVIAIEVKGGNQPFATSAGQAYGYSVMADRCYLADYRARSKPWFNESEVLVAGRLGIGLIAITGAGRMVEVLTAPPHQPIEHLRAVVLDKMGLSTCSLCGTVFRRTSRDAPTSLHFVRRAGRRAVPRAVDEEKGLVWWLYEQASERDSKQRQNVYSRRYLCPDCVAGLFSHKALTEG